MFMFVFKILCHNLLVTNRPEGWYELIESGWVRKIHGYETTSKWQVCTSFSLQSTIAGFTLFVKKKRALSKSVVLA